MKKLFKTRSKREKFKKLERQVKKGPSRYALMYGVFFGLGVAVMSSLLDYLLTSGRTIQQLLIMLLTQTVVGIALGSYMWEQLKNNYLNQKRMLKVGAWGAGVFDDDASCDIIETAIHEDQSVERLIKDALSSPIPEGDYIESMQCYQVIVACAMSHALINQVRYTEIDDLDGWLAKQEVEAVRPFKKELITGLQKVLGERSELNELWAKNKESYFEWRGNIEALLAALDKAQ